MATKKAIVKQIRGITLAAKSDSNHWVVMDGPETFGGSNAGARPKELLLFALGGCTGSDVISILQKRKAPFQGFEIQLTGEVREEHPQVFTDIHVEYVFYGDGLDPQDVERAIELSMTRYCAVSAMLKPSVKITHSYRIEKSKETETR
ncbi:MAG: OsmC family protein [Bacteroidota bacterium]|jgi:putative redox protein